MAEAWKRCKVLVPSTRLCKPAAEIPMNEICQADKNTVGMKNTHGERLFTVVLSARTDVFKMKPRGKVSRANREK